MLTYYKYVTVQTKTVCNSRSQLRQMRFRETRYCNPSIIEGYKPDYTQRTYLFMETNFFLFLAYINLHIATKTTVNFYIMFIAGILLC